MKEISSKSVSKATFWSFVTEIAIKLVSPITSMILARLLLPSAFGLAATITIVTGFAEMLTDAGFQKYIIQHEFKSEEDLKKNFCVAFYSSLAFSFFIVALIFAFRNQISVLLNSPNLNNAIFIASIPIILHTYSSIQTSAYKRDLDFKSLFNIRIIFAFSPFFTTIPLTLILRSYWALVIGGIINSIIQDIVFAIKPKVKLKLFYSFNILKEMFLFSFWTLIESITIWLTTNIDIFIVAKLLNEYYLGLYKTSMTTVGSIIKIISASFIPVMFSTLSRFQNDEQKFKSTFFKFQKAISVFVLPMGFGIYLFRDLATSILLGKNWSEAANFIGYYSIAISCKIIICNFASEVFRSKGQPKISIIYQWIYIFVLFPVIYYSSKAGFECLIISRCACMAFFIVLALLFLCLIYRFNIFAIIKNLSAQVISTLIMFIFGYYLKGFYDSILWQLLTIIICIIIYFAVLLCFKSTREFIFKSQIFNFALIKIRKIGG